MAMGTEGRIVLVTRRTRVDELIVRHNTLAQARFVIESLGLAFDDYLAEDQVMPLTGEQINWLLNGYDIGLMQPHYASVF